MKRVLYYAVFLIMIGIFAFSAYKIIDYMAEKNKSEQITREAVEYTEPTEEKDAGEPERIEVDFDALHEVNADVVAWLYGADTGLNYPIVQGEDNDYYLYRLLDGSHNKNGTLFMDYRCQADFSTPNTLVYGHNMRSGNMFGRLTDYKDPDYYSEHPYLYLMTPTQDYRIELLAGRILDYDADIYHLELSPEYVRSCMAKSTFTSQAEYVPAYSLITLSTCSYEYENARFVVLGQLVPID